MSRLSNTDVVYFLAGFVAGTLAFCLVYVTGIPVWTAPGVVAAVCGLSYLGVSEVHRRSIVASWTERLARLRADA